jgi:hypothetical protein
MQRPVTHAIIYVGIVLPAPIGFSFTSEIRIFKATQQLTSAYLFHSGLVGD